MYVNMSNKKLLMGIGLICLSLMFYQNKFVEIMRKPYLDSTLEEYKQASSNSSLDGVGESVAELKEDAEGHGSDDVEGAATSQITGAPPRESQAIHDPEGIRACGEVCSYEGKVVQTSKPYPQWKKKMSCDNIMQRMAFRDHVVTYPPPKSPPDNMMDAFTMNGLMPINKWDYRISKASFNGSMNFSNERMEEVMDNFKRGDPVNTYGDGNCVQDTLKKYKSDITGKRTVVVGSLRPWLEGILLALKAEMVTTLEYTKIESERPDMEHYHPFDYGDLFLKGQAPMFDFATSFSSIEHAGLGRYTDPLNPYGDFEAMAQIWCMTKPGGYFAVGVPGLKDEHENFLIWNANRVYGVQRLQHLTANWEVVEFMVCANWHYFIVLRKPLDAGSSVS